MVTREITMCELSFLLEVLEAEDSSITDTAQAIELVEALINYKDTDNVQILR